MTDPQPFPLDSATLIMLAAACEVNEATGRSHLHDFLVEYEAGAPPFSPHDAIRALVGEVLRLRGAA